MQLFFIILLLTLNSLASSAPQGCPSGTSSDNTQRKHIQVNKYEMLPDLDNYTRQSLGTYNIYYDDWNDDIGKIFFELTHFKSGVDQNEKVMIDAINQNGERYSSTLFDQANGLQDVRIIDRYLAARSQTGILYINVMKSSPIEDAFDSKFETSNDGGSTLSGVQNWQLVDVALSVGTSSFVLVMKKSAGQYYVPSWRVDDVYRGYEFTTADNNSELYCTNDQFCFDVVNGKIYLEGTEDVTPLGGNTLNASNQLDV